jgi:hypothetical protein
MFSRVLKQVPSNSAINRGIWQDIRAAAGNRMRRRETADVPGEYWQQSMSILKATASDDMKTFVHDATACRNCIGHTLFKHVLLPSRLHA